MLKNDRYMTSRVATEIPEDVREFMWKCIDELCEREFMVDYLQVFELRKEYALGTVFQVIEHRQEVPEYCKVHQFCKEEPAMGKIFVINDGANTTMMLAEEY